ncbi:hypothetical protein ABIE26_001551 [Pedobacter africanus]|uniref:Uncharacterized protein n=1 Tax=Pedobacter africanus TaxID=151894 RepID=A0ACC6KRI8_9SPHI|nr:hypothetical protein [Pedobacter africanus]MDR6781960.1 hypothetical protein [Pedobacter africanus]
MKKIELNQLGVQEMSQTEMANTQGGGPLNNLLGFLINPVTNVVTGLVNTVITLVKSL